MNSRGFLMIRIYSLAEDKDVILDESDNTGELGRFTSSKKEKEKE